MWGDSNFCQLLPHGCKQGGLNIQNPVAAASWMRQSSAEGSRVLVKSLYGAGDLDLVKQQKCAKSADKRTKEEQVKLELKCVKKMKRGG